MSSTAGDAEPAPERCQLCGGSRFAFLLRVSPANFSSRIGAYSIYRCTACELATMAPFPDERDVRELYVDQGVFSVRTPNPYAGTLAFRALEPLYQTYGTDLRFIARQCLRLARAHDAVLDVGCSTGRLLSAFRLPPGALHGIDIDPNAKKNAVAGLGERIVIDDFLQHRFERRFDVITMRFVIEHLLDFAPYLERAVALLEPGGILFLATPDLDSPQARQLGEKWALIDDPKQKIGHLRWFNRGALQFLARRFGLRVEKCVNRGEVIWHLPRPLQALLRRLLGADPVSGRHIRRYTPRILNATLIDGLLAQTLSCGDGLYAFLRKP